MGFSVSAATAVIFAGLFLALGMFYPAMANSYERVQAADADQADRALAQADTAIEINSTSTTDDEINVTNRGSTALPVTETDLVINGVYQERATVTTKVDGNATTELWLPGETLTLEPSVGLSNGDEVRIVTEHGVSASTGV